MSTPPMSFQEAMRAAGATPDPNTGGILTHCGQHMACRQDLLYQCQVCHITVQRVDATNPANIPGSSRMWVVRQQPPNRVAP